MNAEAARITSLRGALLRTAAWVGAALACGTVLMAWLNPHLALEISTLIRACF